MTGSLNFYVIFIFQVTYQVLPVSNESAGSVAFQNQNDIIQGIAAGPLQT